jgi:NADH dehydrogenase
MQPRDGYRYFLRDHIIRQLELAARAADEVERRARCTFVVVGAGYTGTEVAAQGQLLTTRLARQMPGLGGERIRWMLLDTARGCCPNSTSITPPRAGP